MILPSKHMQIERSLLGIGSELLQVLEQPMTVSSLWDVLRRRRDEDDVVAPTDHRWFVLALDLLYMIGAIEFQQGILIRRAPR